MNNLKTFDEWSQLGYKIKKGSKAQYVDCIPMFSSDQVEKVYFKIKRRRSYIPTVLNPFSYSPVDESDIESNASGYDPMGGPPPSADYDEKGFSTY